MAVKGRRLPAVAQLAQLQEHGARIGLVGQIGKCLAQLGDHARARQAKERVVLLFLLQRRHDRALRVVTRHLRQQRLRGLVVGLARQREPQVVLDVVVPRVQPRVVGQRVELPGEGVVHLAGVATVVAVAGAGVEQRVARKQRRLIGVRAQADVAEGVARRVETLELHRLADLDHVAGLHAAIDTRNLAAGLVVRDQLGAGGLHHRGVAAGMVVVLVRVEDLRDAPAVLLGCGQALAVVERVDRQRLAGVGTGDQVIEVAIRVAGPDAFDDQSKSPGGGVIVGTQCPPAAARA